MSGHVIASEYEFGSQKFSGSGSGLVTAVARAVDSIYALYIPVGGPSVAHSIPASAASPTFFSDSWDHLSNAPEGCLARVSRRDMAWKFGKSGCGTGCGGTGSIAVWMGTRPGFKMG